MLVARGKGCGNEEIGAETLKKELLSRAKVLCKVGKKYKRISSKGGMWRSRNGWHCERNFYEWERNRFLLR